MSTKINNSPTLPSLPKIERALEHAVEQAAEKVLHQLPQQLPALPNDLFGQGMQGLNTQVQNFVQQAVPTSLAQGVAEQLTKEIGTLRSLGGLTQNQGLNFARALPDLFNQVRSFPDQLAKPLTQSFGQALDGFRQQVGQL